jgi:sugar lactone lactonase YvrE/enterochelin esterase-like enzyme
MNKVKALLIACFMLQTAFAQTPSEHYPADPASVEQKGVPKGELLKLSFQHSKIFPGTVRDYWVYVPAQYDPATPACVYVNQDGIQFNAPVVFDNLIHKKEIPVTIGIFIQPGRVPAAGEVAIDRINRSFEYDGLGDAYARFILEEILPEVEKQKTENGRQIRLSKNGNDRAIGGSSSGAVAAFTVAWERPNEFTRVFSSIGTYVGFRGAERYSTLVRKYEPRPLRIFLQDGTNDLNNYAGDWWMTAQMMERALSFAGYEVAHAWGEGGHNGIHATAIFPQAMRWLWKGYPKQVSNATSKNQFIKDILIPGENWELVGEGYGFTEGTAVNAAGEVFYQDIPNSKTYKVDRNGKLTTLKVNPKKASGTAFGPDGKRYTVASETKQILRHDENGKETVIADLPGNDITVANNGNIYITSPDGSEKPSKLYLIRPDGEQVVVDEGLKFANGLALSADQTQLYVTESASHWVWVYQVKADGTLAYKQRYGWLHVPDNAENAWSDGLKSDLNGRVYVTSRLGIQVMDEIGRVLAIVPVPNGSSSSNVCFGGPDFNILYVSSRDKVYRRKVNVNGVNAFDKPVKPVIKKL